VICGAFFTTTTLSDVARDAAAFLKVSVTESHAFDRTYPCIKCNIGRNGERIYHLPFDQQYDNVKVDPKRGEMYCARVADAVEAGYRRALRYRGPKSGRG
jgi:hypothetical protein